MLVEQLNNGKKDSDFRIPWENYNNTILVGAYGKLKKIKTKLIRIVNISEYEK
jgi:hypothetical protein